MQYLKKEKCYLMRNNTKQHSSGPVKAIQTKALDFKILDEKKGF